MGRMCDRRNVLIIEKSGMTFLLNPNNRGAVWMRNFVVEFEPVAQTDHFRPFAGAWLIAFPQPGVCFPKVIAKFTRTAITTFATKAIRPTWAVTVVSANVSACSGSKPLVPQDR
jgi:hypothetical protein